MNHESNRWIWSVALVSALLVPLHSASAQSRYDECRAEAEDISGYTGQESRGFIAGSIRGGLGGAAIGAAGGWVTGNRAKKAAKRGAALGALIGGVRAAAQRRDAEEKRETYDRALERCLNRQDR